jgi:hypothetical protein
MDGIRLLARSHEEAIVALKRVSLLTGMPGSYCPCCHAMQSRYCAKVLLMRGTSSSTA